MPTLTIGSLPMDGAFGRMQEMLAEMDARVEAATAAATRATNAATSAQSSITQLQTAAEDLLAANTPVMLDFAPTLALASPGDSSVAYTEQSGWSYKLGPLVALQISVTAAITKRTGTGRLQIGFGELPYLPVGNVGAAFIRSKPGQISIPAGAIDLVGQIGPGQRYIQLATYSLAAGTSTYIGDTHIADATPMTLQLVAWFRTAS